MYDEIEGIKKTKIVGRVFKYLIIGIIILVYLLLMLRICSSGDPESMKRFVWNEAGLTEYNKNNDIKVTAQEPETYITEDGKFSISNIRYIENIGQVQATIRYNNSTVKKLLNDYDLSEKPVGEPFVFMLTDNNGVRYRDYEYTQASKTVYNYRRVIFDGVDLGNITKLYIDVFYIGDVDLNKAPYGSLLIYDKTAEFEEYDIVKSKDLPSGNSQTAGLSAGPAYLIKEDE